MKKKLFTTIGYLLLIAVFVGAGTAIINYRRDHKNDGAKKYGTTKTACDILTSSVAITLITSTNKKTTSTPTAVAKDVQTSQCSYTQTLTTDPIKRTLSLSVQSPTTKESVTDVKQAFQHRQKALRMKSLGVYKDASFWEYPKGGISILRHNVWYTVAYGPTTAADRNISDTENLVDMINDSF